ncbi:hypothetical protein MRB53_016435 [Persea americana]|uniref:Uncharacterized protein n=1 Tax=Persea americana TaxID=3435 RepID=A0ACC2M338_PERAE|nr:hypothetical protein MRB53_016435 [Persea americana]
MHSCSLQVLLVLPSLRVLPLQVLPAGAAAIACRRRCRRCYCGCCRCRFYYDQKKQLSLDDPRISPLPTAPRWRRKIDSPLVEAAVDDFINKILQDFFVDLRYSAITPNKEAPDQVHMLIKDVIGEISGRIKQINLVDLLTRDMVDLIGDHLDIYKRNQSSIGVDVMGTLSSEERDERLQYHLIASKELLPALFSFECPSEAYGRGLGCCLKTKRG